MREWLTLAAFYALVVLTPLIFLTQASTETRHIAAIVAPILGVTSALAVLFRAYRDRARYVAKTEERLSEFESRAEREPEKAKFAWDLARVKLEAYFDRNLFQVNQVFWFAVAMMIVGFGFVLAGVAFSLNKPAVVPATLVAAISGIISQFIGATFLVVYRSTMSQATTFMSILERINTVGMAVQILDSIPDAQIDLKNSTRAAIVKLLLNVRPESRQPKRTGND